MKIRTLPLAFALGLLGGLYMLFVTYYPVFSPSVFGIVKGESLRNFMLDMYPYYDLSTWYGIVSGVAFGFIDCFVFGLLLGGFYNWFSGNCCCCGDSKGCDHGHDDSCKMCAPVKKMPAKKVASKKKK